MEFTKEFTEMWDTKVKQQVKLCSKAYPLLCELQNDDLDKDKRVELENQLKDMDIADTTGVWYVGKLIWAVEHALADNRTDLNFINATCQVKGCLNSESYWENVWKNDFSSEEATNLKKLGEMMNEIMELLG